MNTFEEVTQWLFTQLPVFQHQGASAYKPGLDKMQAFAEMLGQPHTSFPSIHIAGTNGKGSTSHMIASVLQEKGYKVGLYTSPHLVCFSEMEQERHPERKLLTQALLLREIGIILLA